MVSVADLLEWMARRPKVSEGTIEALIAENPRVDTMNPISAIQKYEEHLKEGGVLVGQLQKRQRERLQANIEQLKEIPTSTRTRYAIEFIAEFLGLKVEWEYINGYKQVKEVLGGQKHAEKR